MSQCFQIFKFSINNNKIPKDSFELDKIIPHLWTSLVVQQLGLHVSTVHCTGWATNPGQGTKILHTKQQSQKKIPCFISNNT